MAGSERFTASSNGAPSRGAPAPASIALDLLRGLAAVAVLLFHVRASTFMQYHELAASDQNAPVTLFYMLTGLGTQAVLVFFVISGYLVAGQVIARLRAGRFDLSYYAIDRATRILLPLIPACLFSAAVMVFGSHEELSVWTVVGNMIGLQGVLVPVLPSNVPLWTLSYEIWFYIVGGAAGLLISKRHLIPAVISLVFAVLVFSQIEARYLLYWLLGGLMTFVVIPPRRAATLGIVGLVVAVTGAAAFSLGLAQRDILGLHQLPQGISEALLCGGLCLALPALTGDAVNRALSKIGGFAAALGGFSYSLYLFHYPTNALLSLFFPPPSSSLTMEGFGQIAVRTVVCLAVAILMYQLFERHTGTLRRFLRSRTTGNDRRASNQMSRPPVADGRASARF